MFCSVGNEGVAAFLYVNLDSGCVLVIKSCLKPFAHLQTANYPSIAVTESSNIKRSKICIRFNNWKRNQIFPQSFTVLLLYSGKM